MDTPLNSTDGELRRHALQMWANWMETGDVFLSAEDVKEQMRVTRGLRFTQLARMLKPLNPDQRKLLTRSRELADRE